MLCNGMRLEIKKLMNNLIETTILIRDDDFMRRVFSVSLCFLEYFYLLFLITHVSLMYTEAWPGLACAIYKNM